MTALPENHTGEQNLIRSRIVLDFDVLSRLIAAAALVHLEQTQRQEVVERPAKGVAMWGSSDGLEQALREALEDPTAPRDRWLEEAAEEVGEVIAGAWLQYLDFTLEEEGAVTLGQDLLPKQDHPGSFAGAFRESLGALPIGGVKGASSIMTALARTVLGEGPGLDLPMFLAIDVHDGPVRSYSARRH